MMANDMLGFLLHGAEAAGKHAHEQDEDGKTRRPSAGHRTSGPLPLL
jgi:hypothetical protein